MKKAFKRYRKYIRGTSQQVAPFQWECFGNNAYYFDGSSHDNVWHASMIANPDTHEIYEVTLTSDVGDYAIRWLNPKYKKAFKAEHKETGFDWKQAWDDVEYAEEVSLKKVLKKIKKAFKKKKKVPEMSPFYDDFEVPGDYVPIEVHDVEDTGESLNLKYTIQPPVAEAIINQWIMNALAEEANDVIARHERSESETRKVADEDGCSSDTVEEDQTQWHTPAYIWHY